jgi:hypothetical protein
MSILLEKISDRGLNSPSFNWGTFYARKCILHRNMCYVVKSAIGAKFYQWTYIGFPKKIFIPPVIHTVHNNPHLQRHVKYVAYILGNLALSRSNRSSSSSRSNSSISSSIIINVGRLIPRYSSKLGKVAIYTFKICNQLH